MNLSCLKFKCETQTQNEMVKTQTKRDEILGVCLQRKKAREKETENETRFEEGPDIAMLSEC